MQLRKNWQAQTLLSILIGLLSSIDAVRKSSIPFFVEASLTLFALEPVVFCSDPSVRNLNRGPLDLAIAVRMGSHSFFVK